MVKTGSSVARFNYNMRKEKTRMAEYQNMHKRLRMKFSFVLAYILACIKIEDTLYFYYLLFITSYKFLFSLLLKSLKSDTFLSNISNCFWASFFWILAYSCKSCWQPHSCHFLLKQLSTTFYWRTWWFHQQLPPTQQMHPCLTNSTCSSRGISALPDDAVHRAVIPIRLWACAWEMIQPVRYLEMKEDEREDTIEDKVAAHKDE